MKRPIFVSGAHRSGTTWVGKVISVSPRVRYIHEPFNTFSENLTRPFDINFQYVSKNSDILFQKKVLKYLESYYTLSLNNFINNALKNISFISNVKNVLDYLNRINKRVLIKDPIAIMSAEWIYQQINCYVVISIRHPAAFVESLINKNWHFNFRNLFEQESLINDYLKNYESQIKLYMVDKQPLIKQAVLLWNIIYSVIYQYKLKYEGEWLFVKHEDLSMNPLYEYNKLFAYINLSYTRDVQYEIIRTSYSNINKGLIRNSRDNIKKWTLKMTAQDIMFIKDQTRDVWKYFYDESDWFGF